MSDWLTGGKVSSTRSLLIASKCFLQPVAELTKHETEISAGPSLKSSMCRWLGSRHGITSFQQLQDRL